MEAYTPVLAANSVFEMYTSVLDKWDTSRKLYDTVKCSTEYWGSALENTTVNDFKVEDYRSEEVFYDDKVTVGNNLSAVAQYLDTANEGTSDWWLSPFADEATVKCNDYYCKVTCVVYRPMINTDTANDVQFSEKSKIEVVGGYQVWQTRTTQKNSELSTGGFVQGKSELIEISYGGAIARLSAATASLTAMLLCLNNF